MHAWLAISVEALTLATTISFLTLSLLVVPPGVPLILHARIRDHEADHTPPPPPPPPPLTGPWTLSRTEDHVALIHRLGRPPSSPHLFAEGRQSESCLPTLASAGDDNTSPPPAPEADLHHHPGLSYPLTPSHPLTKLSTIRLTSTRGPPPRPPRREGAGPPRSPPS